MTTKFLENKICTFKILLSWRFPPNPVFWTIFLSAPNSSRPLKTANIIFIVVSPSLIRMKSIFQGRTKGQQLKGKIVHNFHTFS